MALTQSYSPSSPRLFVVKASNSAARKHVARSIASPINPRLCEKYLKSDELQTLRGRDQAGGIYAWGAGAGPRNLEHWKLLTAGDFILVCQGGAYTYVTQVIATRRDSRFAKALWQGKRDGPEETVYELMFFVTKPQRIDVPVASLTEFLPGSYQGFMPIKDERIEAIIAKHGSIQGFAESLIGPTPKGAPQSWIFQGNPEKYDIRAAVNALTEDDWTVSSYKKEIKPGDRIYLWEAGQQGGIVAVAEILDNPSPRPGQPESIPFMKDPSLNTERVRVRIGLRRILDPILGREQIKGTAALANLSILRFSNATNFRVTPEEADVIEALIASQVDSKDLKSVETLRKLYGAFQQSGEYAEWQTKLRSFISDVAAASKEERATPVLQQRLWNDNEVSSPGRGDISVETALADEQFREWVATVSVQPVPEALDQAVAYFEGLYEELVERVRIFTPRVPYLKIFRVLTAFFPKHFTVIADRGSLRALHEAMFVVEQQSAVARHLEVVRRLEEALGPMPTDPAGLVQRMTFPWFLFDTIVRPKVVVPEPPKGGGKQSLLAALREANLYFSEELVANYLLALQTRRFVILTGIS